MSSEFSDGAGDIQSTPIKSAAEARQRALEIMLEAERGRLAEAEDTNQPTPGEGEGPYIVVRNTGGSLEWCSVESPNGIVLAGFEEEEDATDIVAELNRLAGENTRLREKNKLQAELLSLSEQAGLEDDKTLNGLHDQLAAANERVRELDHLRPSVRGFAREMERVLRRHDATKGGQQNWRKDQPEDLVERLVQEVEEVKLELRNERYLRMADEAVDAANFAMMIFDNIKPLGEDPDVKGGPA